MPTQTQQPSNFDLGPAPKVRYIEREVLGTTVRLKVGAHAYNFQRLVEGDDGAAMDLIKGIVHADDWREFNKALANSDHFLIQPEVVAKAVSDPEAAAAEAAEQSPMMKLLLWMIGEVSEGKALKRSSASSTGSARKAVSRRSAGASAAKVSRSRT